MIFGDSIRHTVSMVRLMSVVGISQSRPGLLAPDPLTLSTRTGLLPHAFVPLLQLRRELLAKIGGLKQRANLDLRLARRRLRAALHPLDGLLEGSNLPQPIAGDNLF